MNRLLGILLFVPLMVAAHPGDDPFFSAREAFRNGERVRLARDAEAMRGHELQPWVDYWRLRQRIDDDQTDGIEGFLARESGTYLAEKLRGEWLRALAKKHAWETFQQEYPKLVQPDQDLVCHAWQARLERQQDTTALDEARPLWFTLLDMPDSCQGLMGRLMAEQRLDNDDIWERMRRLLEAKKLPQARVVARYLPKGQEPEAKTLEAIADKPARYVARLPANFATTRLGREMALYAMARMARGDPAIAAVEWRGIVERFGAADRAYGWGQIAWQAALRHLPEALSWYAEAQRAAPTAPLSDEQLAWKVRAALRAHDWATVAATIAAMPPSLAGDPAWTYWLGRALMAHMRMDDAKTLFLKIGGQANFYSNLADEELGRVIALPARAAPPTEDEVTQAIANPGLRRALTLLRLDMRVEGVREWNWTVRGMDDRQLLAAADLARRQKVFDRAISTADRTLLQHDYSLRYLAPFREYVTPRAKALALDSGWVYGLMRQESRFIMNARSPVGASGLMQLMPTTAQWVAKKIGLAGYHAKNVADMDTNVTLGTHYMKMVLDSLGNHPVLASAAYNAGPGRARRWCAEVPLEGAIYAETIPFAETRDYVKKVMSNATYYTALFEERPQSLKSRLGIVRPRGSGDTATPDLP